MILPEIAADEHEFVSLRRHLHTRPELGYEEFETSDLVARLLGEWGYEVRRGLGGTGVVGTLRSGTGGRSLGIRADMDALPIEEETGLPYRSQTPGKMHACGHDGHTTILLAAARQLARSRRFDGTVHLLFQPAEEGLAGARRMMDDGLFELFPCDAVFALHNWPNRPAGDFLFKPGVLMAAADHVEITIRGKGGHGAHPEQTLDPVVAGASTVMALQSVVSRNIDPQDPAVVTVGAFQAGQASNVIPETALLKLSVRSFDEKIHDQLERRITEIAMAQALSYGCTAEVDYRRIYPVLVNAEAETAFARAVAVEVAGEGRVRDVVRPTPGSEDFAFMLQEKPGCYFMLGAGDGPMLHHPKFDFNDAILTRGASYWVHLAERFLPKAA
ncbi:M20 aminoacylase family protein [Prosthecomicrobium sp. N25]|uniref:M20 aminoacylase family protein n=1 Tax=Prosthecomicrobium sp. N25 TaxID=3129254 RepID=UPI0030769E20